MPRTAVASDTRDLILDHLETAMWHAAGADLDCATYASLVRRIQAAVDFVNENVA